MQLPSHTPACRETGPVTVSCNFLQCLCSRAGADVSCAGGVQYCNAAVLHSGTGQNRCSFLSGGQKNGLQEKQMAQGFKTSRILSKLLSTPGELYQFSGSAYQGNVQAAWAAACKQKANLPVPRETGIVPIHSTG